jgi:hypothetical protein
MDNATKSRLVVLGCVDGALSMLNDVENLPATARAQAIANARAYLRAAKKILAETGRNNA